MNDHHKEQISSFMDSEMTDDTSVALDFLVSNETMRNSWNRYHLISDILQRKSPIHIDNQLSTRISESIKQEPTILAPVSKSLSTLLKPVLGIAIAASVAVVSILGIQQYQTGGNPDISTARVNTAPTQLPSSRIGMPVQPIVVSEGRLRPSPIEIQLNAQLSRYIMNHNEYRTNTGVQGVKPYVRMVATEINE